MIVEKHRFNENTRKREDVVIENRLKEIQIHHLYLKYYNIYISEKGYHRT